ncbi:MAG TPA: hypothetical protein VNG32_02070 [Candidatus Dormibacteraeota bacterium]|nr:hypothetical protein [Candidatus Dormibacteraeota bacterium]
MAERFGQEAALQRFQAAHLIAKDFDGTVAQTFERSPNGLGVYEVHELAVEGVFGAEALELYLKNGGLRNRAPLEIVQELAPDAEDLELEQLTVKFIDAKLDILLGEIGSRFPDGEVWPRPTPGYLELREKVELARADGRLIDDLMLTSAHEPFIFKTYRAWGVNRPTHVVAEDTVRRLKLGVPHEEQVKPSPLLMDLARNAWRQSYGLSLNDQSEDELGRIVYIGDDPVKDGELARRSGVDFMLLDKNNSLETWRSLANRLHLGQAALRASHVG